MHKKHKKKCYLIKDMFIIDFNDLIIKKIDKNN